MTSENYLLVNQYDSIVAKSSDVNILKLALCQKERIRIVKGEEGWEVIRGVRRILFALTKLYMCFISKGIVMLRIGSKVLIHRK